LKATILHTPFISPTKVEEPVPVRVVIRTVEILPYAIFRSPKPVTSLSIVATRAFPIQIGRKPRSVVEHAV
jgi:hypothetical protein